MNARMRNVTVVGKRIAQGFGLVVAYFGTIAILLYPVVDAARYVA